MGLFKKKESVADRLPFGWFTKNKKFIDKIKKEYDHFFDNWARARKKSPVEEYSALKSLVIYMNDAKKMCRSKGKDFEFWFSCTIADDDYIKKRTDEMKQLEKDIDKLDKAYKKKQKELKGLDARVLKELKAHDGIKQSDFFKLFDASVKTEVSDLLYQWSKSGKIKRTKSGNTYILSIK